MSPSRRVLFAMCTMSLVGCGASTPSAFAPTTTAAATRQPGVSASLFRGAVRVATVQHPDGLAYGITMEPGTGREVVRVDMLIDGRPEALYFAPTGEQERPEGMEGQRELSRASRELIEREQISLDEALDLALSTHSPDTVQGVWLRERAGRLVVEVVVHEESRDTSLRYDMSTGQPV